MKKNNAQRPSPRGRHVLLASEPLQMRLARAVIAMRYERGWSQAQLGKRSGMSQPFISRLESGGTLPNLAILDRIALAFGTVVDFRFYVPAQQSPRVEAMRIGRVGISQRIVANDKPLRI